MTKSTRLLQLLHILRHRSKRPATAAKLAAELGISPRTLYRDIDTLRAQGADIRGEAGIGYQLHSDHSQLPPLMFSQSELEAIIIGIRWASGAHRADPRPSRRTRTHQNPQRAAAVAVPHRRQRAILHQPRAAIQRSRNPRPCPHPPSPARKPPPHHRLHRPTRQPQPPPNPAHRAGLFPRSAPACRMVRTTARLPPFPLRPHPKHRPWQPQPHDLLLRQWQQRENIRAKDC